MLKMIRMKIFVKFLWFHLICEKLLLFFFSFDSYNIWTSAWSVPSI